MASVSDPACIETRDLVGQHILLALAGDRRPATALNALFRLATRRPDPTLPLAPLLSDSVATLVAEIGVCKPTLGAPQSRHLVPLATAHLERLSLTVRELLAAWQVHTDGNSAGIAGCQRVSAAARMLALAAMFLAHLLPQSASAIAVNLLQSVDAVSAGVVQILRVVQGPPLADKRPAVARALAHQFVGAALAALGAIQQTSADTTSSITEAEDLLWQTLVDWSVAAPALLSNEASNAVPPPQNPAFDVAHKRRSLARRILRGRASVRYPSLDSFHAHIRRSLSTVAPAFPTASSAPPTASPTLNRNPDEPTAQPEKQPPSFAAPSPQLASAVPTLAARICLCWKPPLSQWVYRGSDAPGSLNRLLRFLVGPLGIHAAPGRTDWRLVNIECHYRTDQDAPQGPIHLAGTLVVRHALANLADVRWRNVLQRVRRGSAAQPLAVLSLQHARLGIATTDRAPGAVSSLPVISVNLLCGLELQIEIPSPSQDSAAAETDAHQEAGLWLDVFQAGVLAASGDDLAVE